RREPLCEVLLRARAVDGLARLTVCEEHHRGQREHAVGLRGARVLVDVELYELDVAGRTGKLVERRFDRLARAAPRRPEVDDHGLSGLQDLALERLVGHGPDQRPTRSSGT